MKRIAICILALGMLAGCKKEQVIVVGQSYRIKGDIFNKGVYQPKQPVRVDSLYIDATYNMPYAVITDMDNIKWYIPQEDLK